MATLKWPAKLPQTFHVVEDEPEKEDSAPVFDLESLKSIMKNGPTQGRFLVARRPSLRKRKRGGYIGGGKLRPPNSLRPSEHS